MHTMELQDFITDYAFMVGMFALIAYLWLQESAGGERAMYRMTIQIAIVLATVVLWLDGTTTALTLRRGPVPVSDVPAAAPSTAGADSCHPHSILI